MLNYKEDNKKKGPFKFMKFAGKNISKILIAAFIIVVIVASIVVTLKRKSSKSVITETVFSQAQEIYLPMSPSETYNPLASNAYDIHQLNRLLYASLFELDNNLNVEPLLTESFETNREKGSVKIKLREDAKFSDGSFVTSEDVKFTIDQIKDIGENSPYYRYVSRIDTVDIRGDHLFIISFKSFDDAALDNLVFPIVSANKYSKDENFPLSGGKYKVAQYKEGDKILLESNKYYFGKKSATPVELEITENREMLPGLMTMDALTACMLETSRGDVIAQDKDLKHRKVVSNQMEFLGFNCESEVFSKRERREIIGYALNPKEIIENDYGDSATVSSSIYFPGFLGSSSKDGIHQDLKKANQMLKKEGYKVKNEEGYFKNENSEVMTVKLIVNKEYTGRKDAADTIKSQLKKAGIKLVPEYLSSKEFQEALDNGDYDMFYGGISIDPQFRLVELFGRNNYANYNNEKVINQVYELEKCLEPSEQKKVFKEINKTLKKEMPYYPVCYKDWYFLTPKTFESKKKPVFFDPYRGIETWKWKRIEKKGDENTKKQTK